MHIATNSSKFDISKEIDTAKIAKKVSKAIKDGDVLFFYGDIGVGKTTFIKYLINNLQKINRSKLTEVTSPTFSIVNEYKVGNTKILHYDLYRIKNKKELTQLGIFEEGMNSIKIIEWPELVETNLVNRLELYLKHSDKENERELSIKGYGKWKEINKDEL